MVKSPSESTKIGLLELIPQLIDNSPTLAKNSEQKAYFLAVYSDLEQPELLKLAEMLQAEETQWRDLIAQTDTARKEILNRAEKESGVLEKEASKTVRKHQETVTIATEEQAAEKLLQDL